MSKKPSAKVSKIPAIIDLLERIDLYLSFPPLEHYVDFAEGTKKRSLSPEQQRLQQQHGALLAEIAAIDRPQRDRLRRGIRTMLDVWSADEDKVQLITALGLKFSGKRSKTSAAHRDLAMAVRFWQYKNAGIARHRALAAEDFKQAERAVNRAVQKDLDNRLRYGGLLSQAQNLAYLHPLDPKWRSKRAKQDISRKKKS